MHISFPGVYGSDYSEDSPSSNTMIESTRIDSNSFRLNGQFSGSNSVSVAMGSFFTILNPFDYSTNVPAHATHLLLAIEDRNSFDNCGDVDATISFKPEFAYTNTPLKLVFPSLDAFGATKPAGAIVNFAVTSTGGTNDPPPEPICNPHSSLLSK